MKVSIFITINPSITITVRGCRITINWFFIVMLHLKVLIRGLFQGFDFFRGRKHFNLIPNWNKSPIFLFSSIIHGIRNGIIYWLPTTRSCNLSNLQKWAIPQNPHNQRQIKLSLSKVFIFQKIEEFTLLHISILINAIIHVEKIYHDMKNILQWHNVPWYFFIVFTSYIVLTSANLSPEKVLRISITILSGIIIVI